MTPQQIALLVLGILLVIFIVILIVVSAKLRAVRKREESEEQRADKVKIVKGVRYSTDDVIEDADGMNVTHLPGDFLLSRGEVYRAEPGRKTASRRIHRAVRRGRRGVQNPHKRAGQELFARGQNRHRRRGRNLRRIRVGHFALTPPGHPFRARPTKNNEENLL